MNADNLLYFVDFTLFDCLLRFKILALTLLLLEKEINPERTNLF